ncbi:MAG TPA: HAMP domain-containing sensor histidine kinase, partial [Candidatus Paceibacterota bacterium]|nr:HAMP domain-containing sensor histidine kinase [Candidatus Paceibacterota bacterium]
IVYKHSLELARLTKQLEEANAAQENLLHFISHEIKGYLTKSEAGFASIVEGDYGDLPGALKTMATAAVVDVRKGVATIMDILDASNMKKGTVAFKKEPLDMRAIVEKSLAEQQKYAAEKGLEMHATIADGSYHMLGDAEKLERHVIRNLIDNAIKYTPTGTITVSLSLDGAKLRFSVQDSGVGVTPDDMKHLFTEGGRGKDSLKVNVHSTGYGLYIAKQIVDAHGGNIWAESGGEGKGARFIVELPTTQ